MIGIIFVSELVESDTAGCTCACKAEGDAGPFEIPYIGKSIDTPNIIYWIHNETSELPPLFANRHIPLAPTSMANCATEIQIHLPCGRSTR